jgi:hypothetical protein
LRGGNGLTHSFNRIRIEGPWERGSWQACARDKSVVHGGDLVISTPVILLSEPQEPMVGGGRRLQAWVGQVESVVENAGF